MRNYKELTEKNWPEFLGVLKQMMQIASVKGEPAPGAPFGKEPRRGMDLAMALGQSWGFETGVVNNAVGYVQWSGKNSADGHQKKAVAANDELDREYIGIVGHLDVVPAGEGWHFPPFDLTESDGVLYGRGILDNKGPIMSCFYGMKVLKDDGFVPDKTLRILFGTDEESGMSDIPLYLEQEAPPVFGFTPDCKYPVVYGERGVVGVTITTDFEAAELAELSEIVGEQNRASVPDQLSVTLTGTGETIQVNGKRSPSNAPELGENAITLLAGKLSACQALSARLRAYFSWLYDSFHEKHYGEGINLALADADSGKLILTPVTFQKLNDTQLALSLSFRYPVTVTEAEVISGMQQALFEGAHLAVTRSMPGIMKDKEGPEIRKLTAIYEAATGADGTPVTTTGGTYARKMPNIIAFGPSFPGQKGIAHNKDEYMAVADLKKNMEIYMAAIEALASND